MWRKVDTSPTHSDHVDTSSISSAISHSTNKADPITALTKYIEGISSSEGGTRKSKRKNTKKRKIIKRQKTRRR